MNTKTLRQSQQTFLDACLGGESSLRQVMTQQAVTPMQLARWFSDKPFVKLVAKLQLQLQHSRTLSLQLSASAAATVLDQLASGELVEAKTIQRQACVDLIRLARDVGAAKRATAKPAGQFYQDLIHPEIGRERAVELAQKLEGEAKNNDPI